jgi:hypothetical protein
MSDSLNTDNNVNPINVVVRETPLLTDSQFNNDSLIKQLIFLKSKNNLMFTPAIENKLNMINSVNSMKIFSENLSRMRKQ